jgi:uncharacterized protein Veg
MTEEQSKFNVDENKKKAMAIETDYSSLYILRLIQASNTKKATVT